METCRNRKVRVTIGTAEQNKRGDKNMLSQMNYRKETQPHGDELFPLSIHVFETDLQSTVRVYCHWHEEVELFYAVKGEAVFHMDTETFLLREGETAFVNESTDRNLRFLPLYSSRVFCPAHRLTGSSSSISNQCCPPRSVFHPRQSGGHALQKKRHRPCRRFEICRKEKNRAGSCC